jgi:hypothetical protein
MQMSALMTCRERTVAKQFADDTASPLLTNGFVLKLTAFIVGFALLTAGLTLAAKFYSDRLAMDGHTPSTEVYSIMIGQDALTLQANMIRFDRQRRTGDAEIVNLYLSWPEMEGYNNANADRFSDPRGSQSIVFLEFSQSVMSRDMSGRLEPIYKRLFVGEPEAGPGGLILHRLNARSGFGKEVILTGTTKSGALYVVRCALPSAPADATAADCQRDLHVGRDLSLLYRFSSTLLADWERLDANIRAFADEHIVE